jgi:hypothetical protein
MRLLIYKFVCVFTISIIGFLLFACHNNTTANADGPIWSSYFSNTGKYFSIGYNSGKIAVLDPNSKIRFQSKDVHAPVTFSLFQF